MSSKVLMPLIARKNAQLRRSLQAMEGSSLSVNHRRYLDEKRKYANQLRERIDEIDRQIALQHQFPLGLQQASKGSMISLKPYEEP
jgi:hypothetical protein